MNELSMKLIKFHGKSAVTYRQMLTADEKSLDVTMLMRYISYVHIERMSGEYSQSVFTEGEFYQYFRPTSYHPRLSTTPAHGHGHKASGIPV